MKRLEQIEENKFWDNQSVVNWSVCSQDEFLEISRVLDRLEIINSQYSMYVETNSDSLVYERGSYELSSCIAVEFTGEIFNKK